MKKKAKTVILIGVVCAVFMAVSTWYAVVYNDARLVVPMNADEYVFRIQDLPMILSIASLLLYVCYLFVLLFQEIIKNKKREDRKSVV